MRFFELECADISTLNDGDLRELVARLCEAELIQQKIRPSCVTWGGAQEAADGGLDVHVKDAEALISPNFVPRENTGFQVKKNGMGKASCTNEMLDKGNIKTIITELAKKKGAYIIVSGKDDCSDKMLSERRTGMGAAVTELQNKDDLLLDFYGRDRLTVWLRQHPGVALWVRSRLGKPLSGWMPFGRWATTPVDQDDEFLLDDHPCFIDQNSQTKESMTIAQGIKLTREKLRHFGSTVRITGLSGVGKTRFAQVLFETHVCEDALPKANVIYADLGNDLTPTASELVSYLIVNDFSSYVVLDNCPPDIHRKLQKQITQSRAKLRLLTIEYDISDDRPEETAVVHLEPSSEETVSKLVQKGFPDLGYISADKIAEFAGGNARIALALASRVEADETLTNFTDEELFQRLFSQRKEVTDNLLESAELLSLVYSFNISQSELNDELGVLAVIGGTTRSMLHRSHAELLRRQLSQQRGNWRAVLPHALANRLARRALQNITPKDINTELFKPENFRLFKSCAHRIGYLHDFDPALQLANTWVEPGGPLHDVSLCDEELLAVLNYIAPIFPETVLRVIEAASLAPQFASRNNRYFVIFVRLLCQLAYEDESFDRATAIILKFAETEKEDEQNDNIVKQLSNLFALYLSGTQASLVRRQNFLKRLLASGNPRHQEIAEKLFQSAFEAEHWSPNIIFGFGARKRDSGWTPKTHQEALEWYVGFAEILKPNLISSDEPSRDFARDLFADHFRGLWSFAGCFDMLENVVGVHAKSASWPKMWMSIKKTIYFDGKEYSPELLRRLEALERLVAPTNSYSEIETYAFTNTWDHVEVFGDNYTENSQKIHEKIVTLGELVASNFVYLEKLAPKLWQTNIDALSSFGEGLAKGCLDQRATFEFLICLMQAQKQERVQPILFSGFIKAVYSKDPSLAQQLQERVLRVPELKPHFIYLLAAVPIDSWGVKKLIDVASAGEFEAWRFEQISYGRIHETIADSDMVAILEAINELKAGGFSTLEMLSMRFLIDKNSNYKPNDTLRSVGRQAICKLLSMHRDEINVHKRHGMDRVAHECFSVSSPDSEIGEIVELLCEGIETFRLHRFELTWLINALTKNFPELLLNRVFKSDNKEKSLVHLLFKDNFSRHQSSLNISAVDRIVKWCDGDEDRIQAVATAISVYSRIDKKESLLDNPKQITLSEHAKALLDVAKNKLGIVETIFKNTWPGSYSGSLAEILEIRSKAFAELLEYSSSDVRELANTKLVLIEESIRRNREQEAEKNSRGEQRFE
jgi:hypothetical protein